MRQLNWKIFAFRQAIILRSYLGDRKGCHSVRINKQWRICFVWTDSGPDEVEVVDYH